MILLGVGICIGVGVTAWAFWPRGDYPKEG